jgi:predicted dehydrogenase
MAGKIRLGFVGANLHANWSPRSHFPALAASADVELTAVCTTRQESAAEAQEQLGARFAFHDFREMVASPEIDAVAVVVRVPSHYEPTKAALEAGKHVYTEWPLGRTTAEAEELAALARAKGVRTVVGLQARVDPALMYMKEQIAAGYVGEIMACRVSVVREGVLQRRSGRTWQRDASLGANTLTIANGHTIDALCFVAGDFSRVAAVVSTQAKQWYESDTQLWVDVTAPDHVLVSGRLRNGAVASVHVAAVPWAGSGYQMEIYGREGTLVASGEDTPQFCHSMRLRGARGSNALEDLPIPDRFVYVPAGMPRGDAFNVGQLYHLFAEAIRGRENHAPTFDHAVGLHRLIDTIKEASNSGRELSVD